MISPANPLIKRQQYGDQFSDIISELTEQDFEHTQDMVSGFIDALDSWETYLLECQKRVASFRADLKDAL